MKKKTYYISVGAKQISSIKTATPFELEIEATEDEITELRQLLDDLYSADWKTFLRAHVPYIPYHDDPQNDQVDQDLKKVYQIIYKLGKRETKEHIRSMGLLDQTNDDHSTTM